MAGWAQTAVKKKTNSQNQALNRASFSNLFGSAGIQGQSGTSPTTVSDNAQALSDSIGSDETKDQVSYNSSGVGLIPGTQAYAEWQKQQAEAGNVNTIKNPDAGGGQTDPPEPAPTPGYSIKIGGNSYNVDKNAISGILSGMSAEQQAAVANLLNSGNATAGSAMRTLSAAGIPMQTIMQLQQAVRGNLQNTGQWTGRGSTFMKPNAINGGYGSYEPKWMTKVKDRNWEAQQQREQQPVEPYSPSMPGYITEDRLPPGYTPINGTYDPQSGQPMISQAVGPDGSVWGVGADGMPVQLSGPQQAPPQSNYPGVAYNDIPQYDYGNATIYNFSNGLGTGINLPMLPPEMQQLLMSQLPYFNMYMQGMTPY